MTKNNINSNVKYADIAFRMVAFIALGTFIGQWLDKKMAMTQPIFSIIFILSAIGGGLYLVIKEVSKK